MNLVYVITHTHPLNGPFSGTTRVSQYLKGKTSLDFTEARDSEWQWHQLGRMQVCNWLQTDSHASTPPLSFLQARCPSCRPTSGVKALKANSSCNKCYVNASWWGVMTVCDNYSLIRPVNFIFCNICCKVWWNRFVVMFLPRLQSLVTECYNLFPLIYWR